MEAKDARLSGVVKILYENAELKIVYILNQEWMTGDMILFTFFSYIPNLLDYFGT